MKRVTLFITMVLLFAFGAGITSAQSGYDLYQKALVKERAVGNVEEAIRLYQRIVREFGNNRALAAKAQLRVGLLYERLGRKAEAQRAFQAVVSQYADQTDVVRQAQARVAAANAQARTAAAGANGKATMTMATRRIWAGPGVDGLGAPSPDGQYLSFVDRETGDLAVRDLATEQKRRLTNKGPWSGSIEFAYLSVPSPDGKRVAYSWFNKDDFFELRTIGLDGSEPRVLYRNEEIEYVAPSAWSPDGRFILAILSRKDGTNQIALISVADRSARALKTLDWRYPNKMSFSPDGRYIVYDLSPPDGTPKHDIFLLATDASREVPLVVHPAHDFVLGWVPDGTKILFASDRTGTLGVWMITVIDGKPQGPPELVKPDIGRIWPMGFTRKGSFYYSLDTGLLDVYIAPLDPATAKLLSPPSPATQHFVGANSAPDWSPDGKRLLYHSQRGPGGAGRKVITILSLETGKEREVLPQLAYFHRPLWFPDGRAILVEGRQKSRAGLYKIDPETGEATPVVQSEPGTFLAHAAWSADGKSVFYASIWASKGTTIWAHNLESGEEKVIYRATRPDEISSLAASPDGRWLAFRVAQPAMSSAALMIVSASGGEARELLIVKNPETIQYFNGLAWTRDSRQVLFAKGRSQQPLELWGIPIQGDEPQKLGLEMEGLRYLRLHPDGRRLAFSAGSSKIEVWVMENFLPAAQVQRSSAARR